MNRPLPAWPRPQDKSWGCRRCWCPDRRRTGPSSSPPRWCPYPGSWDRARRYHRSTPPPPPGRGNRRRACRRPPGSETSSWGRWRAPWSVDPSRNRGPGCAEDQTCDRSHERPPIRDRKHDRVVDRVRVVRQLGDGPRADRDLVAERRAQRVAAGARDLLLGEQLGHHTWGIIYC